MRAPSSLSGMTLTAITVAAGFFMAATEVRGQNTLTISGASLTIPQPGVTEFNAGFSGSTTFTFTADPNTGSPGVQRIMTVKIRCASVTGGSKPCGDVQWSSSSPDVVPWTDLTGTFVTVTSRCVQRNTASPSGCVDAPPHGDPINGDISLRMKLAWASDAPASYVATINVTLEVYAQ
jgi:hypothetical protein